MSKWMFDMPKLRLNLSESWNFPKFPLSSSNCCCLVLSSALAFAEAAPFDYFCAAAAIYLYCNLKGQSNCFCNSTRLTRDQILNSTAQDMHIGFQTHLCLSLPTALFYSSQSKDTRWLKITEKGLIQHCERSELSLKSSLKMPRMVNFKVQRMRLFRWFSSTV